MNDQPERAPLTISTECKSNRFNIMCGYLVIGLVSAFIMSVPRWSWKECSEPSDILGWGIISVALFLLIVFLLFLQRGTYVIDHRAITWKPLFRRDRSILWEQMKVVVPTGEGFLLQGKGFQFLLKLNFFPKDHRAAVRARIGEILRRDYIFHKATPPRRISITFTLLIFILVGSWHYGGYHVLRYYEDRIINWGLAGLIFLLWCFAPILFFMPWIVQIKVKRKDIRDWYERKSGPEPATPVESQSS